MPLEITGLVHHNAGSMIEPRPLSEFDPVAIRRYATIQEDAGFDRVLLANAATMPDNLSIATHVAANTTRLQLMIAQRPGFIAPTVAARMLATIDQLSGGRASVHIIAGASDEELKADGDFLTKEERYQRAREYVGILRQIWSSDTPVSHHGTYFRFENALAEVKPWKRRSLPVFFGGSSDTAIDVGAQCADTYALTGDTLGGTAEMVGKIRTAAARHGRDVRFLMTIVLILGRTETEAWAKADHVLERVVAVQKERAERQRAAAGTAQVPSAFGDKAPVAATFQRQLERSRQGTRLDKCFWTGVTQATGARAGNTSTLVGTAAQVADALLDYYDLGIGNFLIRGYQPFEDAAEFGRELIPTLRAATVERDRRRPST